jgi:glycosyltransferase involved in cell wall biosynthesis
MYSSALVAGLAKLWSGCRSPLVASEGIFPSVGILPDLGRFKFPRLHFVRKVQRDVSAVIVCTAKAMVEDGIAFYGCAREKMRIIPNGLDIEAIDRARREPPGHPWADGGYALVAAMGRLCPQKGFDILLDAFAPLSTVIPSVRLVILGKGQDRERLVRQAAALGIADKVDFPGWLPNPHAVISRAAVFSLSSRYEGFPNAMLEAMACCVPVVATDCPSGPSEILEGDVGILVPMDDAKELSDGLRKVLQDPALRDRLAREGRRRVEERYSLDRMVSAYEHLFEEVVASGTGRGLRAERKTPEIRSSSSE